MELFENKSGASFSECRKYRYALWRIWDESKPFVMFIGLNPSKANEDHDDPTIKRVVAISKNLGYGGVYMMNCYAYVSTNPYDLVVVNDNKVNNQWLLKVGSQCHDIICAWGNFDVVRKKGRDAELFRLFPRALALKINKNGSPKHPLYCPEKTVPVNYDH